jgi:hypothetical protein
MKVVEKELGNSRSNHFKVRRWGSSGFLDVVIIVSDNNCSKLHGGN